MLRKSLQISFLLVLMALSFQAASAQERHERIRFARGTHQATKIGTIKGYATVVYKFGVGAGQHISVKLKSKNPSVYFSFGDGATTSDVTEWDGDVRETGDYTVTVYMMRSTARRGTVANYALTVRAE